MELPAEFSIISDWLSQQQNRMAALVENWANVNSGSANIHGLDHMHHKIMESFSALKGRRSSVQLPPAPHIINSGEIILKPSGKAFLVRNRSSAPLRILLGGHMDTVFDKNSSFQKCEEIGGDRLKGPGVADMKGGLVVMLYALKALENSPFAENIGWDVLITPDEETGSVGSIPLWKQLAWQNHIGMLFEPAFSDGSIVSARKGSNTYYAIAHGRKAHAGRDFLEGKNALAALSMWVAEAHRLNAPSIFVNVGYMQGGEAANIVPDKAYCMLNVRAEHASELLEVEKALNHHLHQIQSASGVSMELFVKSRRPPKPCEESTQRLIGHSRRCAEILDIPLETRPTGGVCDGNNVAA